MTYRTPPTPSDVFEQITDAEVAGKYIVARVKRGVVEGPQLTAQEVLVAIFWMISPPRAVGDDERAEMMQLVSRCAGDWPTQPSQRRRLLDELKMREALEQWFKVADVDQMIARPKTESDWSRLVNHNLRFARRHRQG